MGGDRTAPARAPGTHARRQRPGDPARSPSRSFGSFVGRGHRSEGDARRGGDLGAGSSPVPKAARTHQFARLTGVADARQPGANRLARALAPFAVSLPASPPSWRTPAKS